MLVPPSEMPVMPLGPLRRNTLSAPTAIRIASSARLGSSWPATEPTSGTRRTMPSTSGVSVTRPSPAAASLSTGVAPTSPGSSGRKRRGSSPSATTGVDLALNVAASIAVPIPATPSTTSRSAMAPAISTSLSGSALRAAASLGSRPARASA